MRTLTTLSLLALVTAAGFALAMIAQETAKAPVPKVTKLDAAGKDYLPLLQGPPETVTMHSGLVVLAPGKSVGKHSTKGNEEMIVVLEGRGEMRITGGKNLPFSAGEAIYCPPKTEHDMVNTGEATLRYVYIVARAEG